jgi:hypothetical protein
VWNDSGLVIDCDRPSNNLTDNYTLQPLSQWKSDIASDCSNKEISTRFIFEQKKKGICSALFPDRTQWFSNLLTSTHSSSE